MKNIGFWVGKALSAVLICAAVALIICLAKLQMLPTVILVVIAGMLMILIGVVMYLTWTGHGKVRMAIGIGLAVITAVCLGLGISYIAKALNTFDAISGGQMETVHVGIYVRSDDTNDYNDVAASYRYGILQSIDRESTDIVLQDLNKNLGTQVTCLEYKRLPELIDGLLNREVDAIIINQALLDLLQDMVGYEDKLNHIREAVLKKVEIETPGGSNDANGNAGDQIETDITKRPFGVYISGIDTAGSVSTRSRSDVNILAVVNPATRQVLLVSTPRDYFVPLSISNGIPDKLTHAGIYGVNVSKDTLGLLYGIDMEYYFRVNFSGFEKIIDALDGVTVNSAVSFSKNGYTFIKGENYMDGKAALVFCRERYSLAGGDRQRGKNQMAVIKAVINKAMSPALLMNYSEVLKAIEGNFETTIPMEIISALVSEQLKNGSSWNVVTYSVDGKGDYQIPYSMSQNAYVMQPDYETVEHAKSLIQSVLNGEVPTP